ncbi:thiamine ABC transporter substrate-binding protein [Natronobeatus ordinarius]|uniref:thiamine ABC transporter substrate-binding protein n=1 Tax=Natronobeatus ordinarius TaxID=2963433 RepID=UPI0020CBFDA1|nr:extracellular solute-binding protein [Natronobeatus ordinarius]
MNRRTVLHALGCGAAVGFAGCQAREDDEEEPVEEAEDTLVVATVESIVEPVDKRDAADDEDDETEESAGEWLRAAFEEAYDVDLEWTVPEDGVNHYVQRARQDAVIEPDVYLGLTVDDLAFVDEELGAGGLFDPLERDRLERDGRVQAAYDFGDPFDRVIPYGTEYVSLVFDEAAVDPPKTFVDLTDPAYEGTLLVPNARRSVLGRSFLFWTIDAVGEDGYVEYWNELLENDVRLLPSRRETADAYLRGDRPMAVSHSAVRVAAVEADRDLSRYQVSFLDEQGYANVGGMAVFADPSTPDLAADFLDFVLSREVQSELASRTHRFPAVTDEYVDLEPPFAEYALEPPDAAMLRYDDLEGSLDGWLDTWAQLVAGR